ncbi:uncharacterized protein [Dermacentor albipictus]|uniref:uncharacterized protein n=1 Tax=Dermacentor albipictus TaxID=60249 RepID=UPI0038FC2503
MTVPAYYPALNGGAEQVVQIIKDKLKKRQAGDFRTQVARVLFQYWTTPQQVPSRAPRELLLGRMVKTPLKVLHPDLRSTALLKQLKQKLAADRGCCPVLLPESGAQVFARNFRASPRWSSAQVVSPASASSLLVRMPDGTTWHRYADHKSNPQGDQWPDQRPVAASEAPPTSEAASVATCAAPFGPVSSPAPLSRPATADHLDGERLAQAALGVATPGLSTPVPRRSTRPRRPPDRYSRG